MVNPRFEHIGRCFGRGVRRASASLLAGAALVALLAVPAMAQTGSVTGIIMSGDTNEPLGNVQVTIDGTGLGAVTTTEGRYLILQVPAGEQTLRATMIGFGEVNQTVTVPAGGSVSVDPIRMYTSAVAMEGLVVTGTAIASQRREIGNSIALITGEEIAASGVKTLDDILRKEAVGVTVGGSTGTVGAGAAVTIRGMNSLNGRNNPLIYVDGVRLNPRDSYEPATSEATQAATVLNSINPQDIERIEIIKGAAATTLYGSEATAGVIQIFTKRGGEGEARWNFTTSHTFSQPRHVGPDSDPTGLHLNDCTFGGPVRPDQTEPDPGCPESGSWLKTAYSQDYDLSVRGGGENFSYFGSAGWSDQVGIINVPERFDDQTAEQLNLRANLTFNPFEDLQISLNSAYNRQDLLFYPDGDNAEGFLFNVTFLDEGETPDNQDDRIFELDIVQDIDQFTGGINLNWTPLDNFRHRINAGLDWSRSNERTNRPFGFWRSNAARGDREVDIEEVRVITLDYAGSWAQELTSDIRSTFSWGGQYIDREDLGVFVFCEDFSGPGTKTLRNCEDISSVNEDRFGFKNGGFFAQEQIGINNRLYITGGVRADTHSSFGEGADIKQNFVFFPKAQITYTLSDHDFFPDVFETFRLRGAYGESGEPPPSTASKTFFRVDEGGENDNGFEIDNLGNVDIGPEGTREFEGGIDAGLFNGRLQLEATGFYRKTFDGLIFFDLTPSAGVAETFPSNVGQWDARGVEAGIDALVLDSRDFRVNFNGNYQWVRSEMLEIGPDEDNILTTSFSQGFKAGFPFPAQFRPVITNPDEVGVEPEFSDTLEFNGITSPVHQISVGTNITFFDRLVLDVFGVGAFGHVLEDDQGQDLAADGLWPECVDINNQVNGGDLSGLTALEIARCSDDFASTAAWTFDADYFRIQSAALSYRLPEEWLPAAVSQATLQFRVENLKLFTDFPGIDPDALNRPATFDLGRVAGFTLPAPRRFNINLRATF